MHQLLWISALALVLTGCDLLQLAYPMDDPPAPYVCTNTVYGRVEAEWDIDCQVFQQLSDLAVQYDTEGTSYSPNIPDGSFRGAVKSYTVHVKKVRHWTSGLGEDVIGETWLPNRIDIGFDAKALAHESLHAFDLANTHLDTMFHPDWDKPCKRTTEDVWSCNYYAASEHYAYWSNLNWYGNPPKD